ncbi:MULTISPECIES: LPS assembly lipoprotein LptE [Rhizobium]|uniref:LPS assembly lipoprotein LptE n=1 Tax=Rhizobium TaxID=379 RepID=UPI0007EA2BFD|nr:MULTISPECIES: LPS assembly lipoprotein LptE [Rhizobium]ANK93707.1 lipopolysccharide assembly LptE family protein [Rhizobium sp. N6212]ANK99757.1 lipopolysccharide assembly LptE family protein [Rhizobium sp. N621]ANL05887.1 lipopolysccharide assembly LptE family protein [Rhizobium esperanzae]ANL11937.1 lipopolysccharide assembly LptE family protein [Rhizobium sp. N1341]ANM36726.1 lipopolysccharide assembly LptE family protein [Rhizobium sp. N871]
MSSDISRRLARNAGIAMILAASAFLSACQVRPLYSENSGVVEKLSSVGFSDAASRVEQQVRNHLIFLASRGAGEAANPQYHVQMRAASSVADTLLRQSGDTSRAGRVTVTVTYTLSAVADGHVIKAGSRQTTALVDFSEQEFAKQRAIRDAENRAADQAAEFVGADLAAALSR